jgi:hypothetical protein
MNLFKIIVFQLIPLIIQSQTIYFAENFEKPPPLYGWEAIHKLEGSNLWRIINLPDGGWNGTQAAMLVAKKGERQFNIGWYNFSARKGNFPKQWKQGDAFYVRFRVRFPENMRWDGTGSQQNKLFVWGAGKYNGENHRVMLHQEANHPTSPCCNMEDKYKNTAFGLFSLKQNITENCTPGIAVTFGKWYHIQFYVKSSSTADSDDAVLRLWVNNNEKQRPSSETIGFNLAVQGIWDQGFTFGGFWTDANPNRDYKVIFDDFEIADFFDDQWNLKN